MRPASFASSGWRWLPILEWHLENARPCIGFDDRNYGPDRAVQRNPSDWLALLVWRNKEAASSSGSWNPRPINWPSGMITFESRGFTQVLAHERQDGAGT